MSKFSYFDPFHFVCHLTVKSVRFWFKCIIIFFLLYQDAGRRAFWSINGPRILQVGYEDEENPKVMEAYERVGSLVSDIRSSLNYISKSSQHQLNSTDTCLYSRTRVLRFKSPNPKLNYNTFSKYICIYLNLVLFVCLL